MRLELRQTRTLGLYLDQKVGDDPVQIAANRFPYKEIDFAGEQLKYKLAPNTFLDAHGNESGIGFDSGDAIFVPKNMHTAIQPIAALYLTFNSMGRLDLEDRFGKTTIEGLNGNEIRNLVLESVLGLAKDYLYPQQMKDLVHRFRSDPEYNNRNENTFREIVDMYDKESKDAGAMIRAEDTRLDHYLEGISAKVGAHQKSQFVKSSRSLHGIMGEIPGLGGILRAFVSSSEPAYSRIISNPEFNEYLPEVIMFLSGLQEHEKGTKIKLGIAESRLMFECYEASIHYRHREPFKWEDGNPNVDGQENYMIITGQTNRFLESVVMRLKGKVLDEHKVTVKQLEGARKIAAQIAAGDKEMAAYFLESQEKSTGRKELAEAEAAAEKAEVEEIARQALIPYTGETEAEEAVGDLVGQLVQHERSLGYALLGAPRDRMDLRDAVRAKELLQRLGLNPEEVEAKIDDLLAERSASLKKGTAPKIGPE
ncbi:hypothetical protein HN695_02860 [Candidatus Woesearchaeota archaeon]|jgi:hypothetical protein|nr:hypothetical protein [Candidatus Woesearchaeota archaeon]MBT5272131.1 hypothetical protein [Candidatus Woesearchaeota archaeon]MBT6040934.1 hypothetical protein [Candidatus Woesearchaeota archaeon]MBT6336268.1 hypothetical protein [Candidatus Woesearchaeota archaeon]MBT7927251.1 hypothetical protein [Candidatus Woesearchaeota archaeon]